MKNIFFGPVGASFQEWGVRALQNVERWINTLTEFRGATALRDGADGLVPQPKIGDQTKFLSGDGTFKTVPGGGGGSGTGDVVGPASATDNAIVRFDATTGKLIQNSVATLSDAGTLSTPIVTVTDDAYSATWDGSTAVPTKNAVYDKIQTLGAGGGGNVSNVGTPVDNQLAIWKTATTIEGSPLVTYDGTTFTIETLANFQSSLQLLNTQPGNFGAMLDFYHNSASPAAADTIGAVTWWGNDSAIAKQTYVSFQAKIDSPTAGARSGSFSVSTLKNNVAIVSMAVTNDGITVGTDDPYGAGWDGSLMLPTKNAVYDKIQTLGAGGGGNVSNVGTPVNNQIAIWTDATHVEGDPDFTYDTTTNILALAGTQIIQMATAGTVLSLRSTDAGAAGPVVEFWHNSASPAVGDVVATTYYYGNNSAAASKAYAIMSVSIVDPVAATEDGIVRWYAMKAGTATNVVAFDGAGLTSFFDVFTTDEAYGVSWNGSLAVPTKNAVYDKIETLGSGGGAGAAKCWGRVTVSGGVPTLAANLNVTSITDTNVGRLTVTIGTDFASADYCVIASYGYVDAGSTNYAAHVNTTTGLAAGSFELITENASGVNSDLIEWYWACFGT